MVSIAEVTIGTRSP